jgi:hypothetical protein
MGTKCSKHGEKRMDVGLLWDRQEERDNLEGIE